MHSTARRTAQRDRRKPKRYEGATNGPPSKIKGNSGRVNHVRGVLRVGYKLGSFYIERFALRLRLIIESVYPPAGMRDRRPMSPPGNGVRPQSNSTSFSNRFCPSGAAGTICAHFSGGPPASSSPSPC
jgi:hypothetical protein